MDELEQLKLVLRKAHSAVYEWNVDKDAIHWVGGASATLFLSDVGQISNKQEYTSLLCHEDQKKYLKTLEDIIKKGGDYSHEYRLILGNGTLAEVRDEGTVMDIDGQKTLVGMINIKNINETEVREKSEGEKGFKQMLEKVAAHSFEAKTHGSLVYLSIDNLATVMSWYSIDLAEKIMVDLENGIRYFLEDKDVFVRTSIDQFSLIFVDHVTGHVPVILERIHKFIHNYEKEELKDSLFIKSSSGSVLFPDDAETVEEICAKAFQALIDAKDQSTNSHSDYHEAKRSQLLSKEQAIILKYMRTAMREDRMCVAYQPIIESKTGKVVSYETLLRIEEEDGQITSAGAFVPIAEKMGLIDRIDQFILEHIVQELDQHKDIVLGFNVSNITTDNPKWLKNCTKLLENYDVASRMIIEITETAAQRDMSQTAYFVASLQALGCKVALDDFGAGYTSFRQLKSLSVDMVKIDGAYVLDLAENSENLLFIKTLLDFNQSYGLKTIAECVETGDVAKILMDIGVEYMQGYYFGKAEVARPWAEGDQARQIIPDGSV